MSGKTDFTFGNLTLKSKKSYDITELLGKEDSVLDSLFKDNLNKLEALTVIDAERQAALENLRALTTKLQTRRLREKARSSNKYFSL